MAVLGAVAPRIEAVLAELLTGHETRLLHPVLALEAGTRYVAQLEDAEAGELGPVVLVVEGTMFDQSRAGSGEFSRLGEHTIEEWVTRFAAVAALVLAIGTCATWGGVPAARGNVTGAGGVGGLLGPDFRSRAGVPLVNVPGCAPSGDAFVEVLVHALLHLQGHVPLDLDDLGRPRWLYGEETPVTAAGAEAVLDGDTLMACCPVPVRGWINRLGGCATVGGACSGCTRGDYPDATLPLIRVG